jgi:hypothetical protein
VLRYDHLAVRDGAGRELEARMARMEGVRGRAWRGNGDARRLACAGTAAQIALSGDRLFRFIGVGSVHRDRPLGEPELLLECLDRLRTPARPMFLCAAVVRGASSRY